MFLDADDLFAEMGTLFGMPVVKKGNVTKYPVPSFPPANIFVDADDNFCLNFALAGYKKDELDISFKGDFIIVATNDSINKQPAPKEPNKEIVHNIKKVSFKYSYMIPENMDKEKVSAKFEDGILSIIIPEKKQKDKREFNITIK